MRKIVFAMPQLYGGGAERVVAALAEHICALDNYEVHMLTYIHRPEMEYLKDSRVIWHSFDGIRSFTPLRVLNKVLFVRRELRCIDPDCVVSLAGPAMISVLCAAMSGLRAPLVLSERNDPVRYPTQRHLRLLREWAYGRADAIIFQTNEAMAFFNDEIRKKGKVICNPLVAELPEPYTGCREKRIVTSSRLSPQKNLDLLIDAFSDLGPQFLEYKLDIYGEGGEKDRLQNKINELMLADRVTLRGYSNNIYADIEKAAVFVLSSDYEGISNSMLEAIALGIPTICTDCPAGGARETITHGYNGLLTPVGDRKALVDAMKRLLSDDSYAAKLGRNGIQLRSRIHVNTIARQWLDVINRVIG